MKGRKNMNKMVFEKGERKAIVSKSDWGFGWIVQFYFGGYQDYEWKRGSGGIALDSDLTKEQAIRKAKYYINK